MLTEIFIRNYIIIDKLSISLRNGFTVLTGETGAGKSLWIDALQLALGERADNLLIKKGCDQLEITLNFDLSQNTEALHWLKKHNFDYDDQECLIRRIIFKDGKTRSTLNGQPIAQYSLRELSPCLVSIHSQHQAHSLLHSKEQRNILDKYAKNHILLAEISVLHNQWQNVSDEINQLEQKLPQRDQQLEFLEYNIEELQQADLENNPWNELCQQQTRMHKSKDILSNLQQIISITEEHDDSITNHLNQVNQLINCIDKIDSQALASAKQLILQSQVQIQEALIEMQNYQQQLELNPEKIQHIDETISIIYSLARKHRCQPDQLNQTLLELQQQHQDLLNIQKNLDELQKKQQIIIQHYQAKADQLSHKRAQASKKMQKTVSTYMQSLGMQGGEFHITMSPVDKAITPYGQENIVFMVKTNIDQDIHPINKGVSGGELSRLSLALQTILTDNQDHACIIFDEVDVGIGGKTAEIVGTLLHDLSQYRQVLCITHLAQVAAKGDYHLQVNKKLSQQKTQTEIIELTPTQRIDEIARMLGGSQLTPHALAHAKELVAISEYTLIAM